MNPIFFLTGIYGVWNMTQDLDKRHHTNNAGPYIDELHFVCGVYRETLIYVLNMIG
jgi:hypothetical protein